MEPLLFGQVLLNFNLVTQEQLDTCLALQETSGGTKPLGEILIDQGFIDDRTLATILSVQERRGARTPPKVDDALAKLNADSTATDFLSAARAAGASDLYLSSKERPTMRLHGALVELPVEPMSFERCRDLVFALLSAEQIEGYYAHKQIDASLSLAGGERYRANVYRHFGGIGAVFRIIPDAIRPFDTIGLPSQVRDFVDFKHGLVLVTGATGCGKSTTLAALIDHVNQSQQRHVITLEDPIETVFQSHQSLITQRQIPTHADSFESALRAAMREDADILVVGEMRTPETIRTALIAAETGHLVFGTLHTRNAFNTIVRIVEQFPVQQRPHVRSLLASTLRAVVCQELIPNVDGRGRSLASEVMIVNQAIANLIREDRAWQIPMVMQTWTSRGMQLMDESLERLVKEKRIPISEALARAANRDRFVTVPN